MGMHPSWDPVEIFRPPRKRAKKAPPTPKPLSVKKAQEYFREVLDRELKVQFSPTNTKAVKIRQGAWAETKRMKDPEYAAKAAEALLAIGRAAVEKVNTR